MRMGRGLLVWVVKEKAICDNQVENADAADEAMAGGRMGLAVQRRWMR